MRWRNKRQSDNVEDIRGQRRSPMGRVGGGFGLGTILIALLLWYMGGNPMEFLIGNTQGNGGFTQQSQVQNNENYSGTQQEEDLADIAGVVLHETENVWARLFKEQLRAQYQPAKLVLFEQSVSSACGMAGSASGPFYCPADSKVYLDVDFYDQLKNRFGAPGDFAFAYVVAHEIGHHVQNLLGYTDYVHKHRGRIPQEEYNKLSVKLELQADFFAGVWAHHSYKTSDLIEREDFMEAINAASAIGDDNIQRQTTGHVRPEAFTHGTSEQRKRWFTKGLESGQLRDGDTFNTQSL